VLLLHYFSKEESYAVDDTLILDKSGRGVFKGKKPLDKGMYFLVSDRKKLFDFIIGDVQHFEILAADTTDLIGKLQYKNSLENDVLVDFQRTNIRMSLEANKMQQEMGAAGTQEEKRAIQQRLMNLSKDRITYIQKQIDDHPGLFVSKFLTALIPMTTNLPDYPRDAAGNITDSSYVYRWYRAHFFDHLNIADQDMLRTPLFDAKVMEYFTSVLPQIPDTLCAEADKILTKVKHDEVLLRYILAALFNYYAKSEIIAFENVWVHLAENWYIPHAPWMTAEQIKTMKQEVTDRSPTLLGKMAPPIDLMTVLPPDHFKAAALDTAIKFDIYAGAQLKDFRQSVKSKYTVLLFWDITCPHCRETIQELHELYENELKNKNVTVITLQTVNTKEAKGKWIDFANEHQLLDWVNAWSPYDATFRKSYTFTSLPQIYVLNEKKEIIGKKIVPEQLKIFIP
jgi:thiol-disulfide isomerase/thioredoxin